MNDIFIATLAVKSVFPEVLAAWKGFVDILRINASHLKGSRLERQARLIYLVKLCNSVLPGIPLAFDTRGRERRLGIVSEIIRLLCGNKFELGPGDFSLNGIPHLPFEDEKVYDELDKGFEGVLCDGQIRFVIEGKSKGGFLARVIEGGGEVSSNKSIMFPKISMEGPVIIVPDEEDLEFINKNLLSFIWFFFSFTQRGRDIQDGRNSLRTGTKVAGKPENEFALAHIGEQAKESDMMMVPRGDGRQAFGKRLPYFTRFVIKESNAVGTPAFVATGVTASMIHTMPTLSQGDEHAIWSAMEDGACGFMESDGTVNGNYVELVPEAVKGTMHAFRENEPAYRQLGGR